MHSDAQEFYRYPQWVPALHPRDHEEVRMRKNPGDDRRRQRLQASFDTHQKKYPDHHIGFISSENDPYALIDIDPPKALKEEFMALSMEEQNAQRQEYINRYMTDVPETFRKLTKATYTEVSASGLGLRCIVRVDDRGQMKQLGKNWVKCKGFEGQANLTGGYMICTQQIYHDAAIVTVKDSWFKRYFKVQEEAVEADTPSELTSGEISQLVSLGLLRRCLKLPIDQNDKVKRTYKVITGEAYEHYEYWRLIACCIRDYSVKTLQEESGFRTFVEWSKRDSEGFVSEEDCRRTWTANPPKLKGIGYKTLIRFLQDLEYSWPEPVVLKSGDLSNRPVETSHKNFTYFLSFHDIVLHKDTMGQFFVTGDAEVLDEYFLKRDAGIIINGKTLGRFYGPFAQPDLINIMAAFMQAHGYGSRLKTVVVKTLLDTMVSRETYEPFNIMQEWLKTPFEELPETLTYIARDGCGKPVGDVSKFDHQTNLDFICRQISLHPLTPGDRRHGERIRRILLYRFFMGMAKLLTQMHADMLFDENAGMLLLIGGEGTRKTTFFKFLVPKALQDECVFIPKGFARDPGEKTLRDLYRRVATSGYIVFDEFDAIPSSFMQAEMKKFISDNKFQFTEIYSTASTTLPRHAGIGGTTNDFDLRLSDHGNRRIWPLLIADFDSETQEGGINTDALLRFNWHKFYNDLIDEFNDAVERGETPWLPTTSELKLVQDVQSTVTADTGLGMALSDLYPPEDYPFPGFDTITRVQVDPGHAMLKTMREIIAELEMVGIRFKRPELKRALQRFCGRYTGTVSRTVDLPNCTRAFIKDGLAKQGQHSRWVLPPMKGLESAPEEML